MQAYQTDTWPHPEGLTTQQSVSYCTSSQLKRLCHQHRHYAQKQEGETAEHITCMGRTEHHYSCRAKQRSQSCQTKGSAMLGCSHHGGSERREREQGKATHLHTVHKVRPSNQCANKAGTVAHSGRKGDYLQLHDHKKECWLVDLNTGTCLSAPAL